MLHTRSGDIHKALDVAGAVDRRTCLGQPLCSPTSGRARQPVPRQAPGRTLASALFHMLRYGLTRRPPARDGSASTLQNMPRHSSAVGEYFPHRCSHEYSTGLPNRRTNSVLQVGVHHLQEQNWRQRAAGIWRIRQPYTGAGGPVSRPAPQMSPHDIAPLRLKTLVSHCGVT